MSLVMCMQAAESALSHGSTGNLLFTTSPSTPDELPPGQIPVMAAGDGVRNAYNYDMF